VVTNCLVYDEETTTVLGTSFLNGLYFYIFFNVTEVPNYKAVVFRLLYYFIFYSIFDLFVAVTLITVFCHHRMCSTMRWTAMKSGRRRNQENPCLTVKG